jgi:hypothetical protein
MQKMTLQNFQNAQFLPQSCVRRPYKNNDHCGRKCLCNIKISQCCVGIYTNIPTTFSQRYVVVKK